jgi:hypothetical protein
MSTQTHQTHQMPRTPAEGAEAARRAAMASTGGGPAADARTGEVDPEDASMALITALRQVQNASLEALGLDHTAALPSRASQGDLLTELVSTSQRFVELQRQLLAACADGHHSPAADPSEAIRPETD